jgi:hypothetical protein
MSGTSLAMNSSALRGALDTANVTVITSSRGTQVSREDETWQHGAFTKVLLDAFNDPAADADNDGLISMNSLADYIYARVDSLTEGAQLASGRHLVYQRRVIIAAAGLVDAPGHRHMRTRSSAAGLSSSAPAAPLNQGSKSTLSSSIGIRFHEPLTAHLPGLGGSHGQVACIIVPIGKGFPPTPPDIPPDPVMLIPTD